MLPIKIQSFGGRGASSSAVSKSTKPIGKIDVKGSQIDVYSKAPKGFTEDTGVLTYGIENDMRDEEP